MNLILKILFIFNKKLKDKYEELSNLELKISNIDKEVNELNKEKNIKENELSNKLKENENIENELKEIENQIKYINDLQYKFIYQKNIISSFSKSKYFMDENLFYLFDEWLEKFKVFAVNTKIVEDEFEIIKDLLDIRNNKYIELFINKKIMNKNIVKLSGKTKNIQNYIFNTHNIQLEDTIFEKKIPILLNCSKEENSEIKVVFKDKKINVLDRDMFEKILDGYISELDFNFIDDIKYIVFDYFDDNNQISYLINYEGEFLGASEFYFVDNIDFDMYYQIDDLVKGKYIVTDKENIIKEIEENVENNYIDLIKQEKMFNYIMKSKDKFKVNIQEIIKSPVKIIEKYITKIKEDIKYNENNRKILTLSTIKSLKILEDYINTPTEEYSKNSKVRDETIYDMDKINIKYKNLTNTLKKEHLKINEIFDNLENICKNLYKIYSNYEFREELYNLQKKEIIEDIVVEKENNIDNLEIESKIKLNLNYEKLDDLIVFVKTFFYNDELLLKHSLENCKEVYIIPSSSNSIYEEKNGELLEFEFGNNPTEKIYIYTNRYNGEIISLLDKDGIKIDLISLEGKKDIKNIDYNNKEIKILVNNTGKKTRDIKVEINDYIKEKYELEKDAIANYPLIGKDVEKNSEELIKLI